MRATVVVRLRLPLVLQVLLRGVGDAFPQQRNRNAKGNCLSRIRATNCKPQKSSQAGRDRLSSRFAQNR
jgi:hypothetical protein